MDFYGDRSNLLKMMRIINGESKISLRIVDWFVTNYAKKYYTVYEVNIPVKVGKNTEYICERFKVYNEYKLKLKAYQKVRFDPFCRWVRITIPYDEEKCMETTIGQLNFFKWAIEHNILEYIENNYSTIEADMNTRNSTSKRKRSVKSNNSSVSSLTSETDMSTTSESTTSDGSNSDNEDEFVSVSGGKTRKKREELSVSACKCIVKENVKIVVKFI
jgi:hypothetical protein